MTSNPSNSINDPFFVTPDPSFLQSEENRADMHEKAESDDPTDPFYVAEAGADDETAPFDLDEISRAEGDVPAPGFDPDSVAQSGNDPAISDDEQDLDSLRDRQIGTAFRSGS
jgi:hypothetical protein